MNELNILQDCLNELKAMTVEEFEKRCDERNLAEKYYNRTYSEDFKFAIDEFALVESLTEIGLSKKDIGSKGMVERIPYRMSPQVPPNIGAAA